MRKASVRAHYYHAGAPDTSTKPLAPSRGRDNAAPGTFFITFTCYGAKLHGEDGTVDLHHNAPGTPRLSESRARLEFRREHMRQLPYALDEQRRSVILRAIMEVCDKKLWTLLAAHVRTNHVHVVVQAEATPEWVMSTFKRYSSRALNRLGIDERDDCRRWARHGSTRYIWTKAQLSAAIRYTVGGQGGQLAVYEAP